MTDNRAPLVVQTDAAGQPTARPTRKLGFGMAGGASVIALIVAVFPQVYPALAAVIEAHLPPEWAALVLVLIGAIAAYFGVVIPAYAARNRATSAPAASEKENR